jgi:hypothetical protein
LQPRPPPTARTQNFLVHQFNASHAPAQFDSLVGTDTWRPSFASRALSSWAASMQPAKPFLDLNHSNLKNQNQLTLIFLATERWLLSTTRIEFRWSVRNCNLIVGTQGLSCNMDWGSTALLCRSGDIPRRGNANTGPHMAPQKASRKWGPSPDALREYTRFLCMVAWRKKTT